MNATDEIIDYKGLSERACDVAWNRAEMLCPADPQRLVQGIIDEMVRSQEPDRSAFDRRVRFAMDNNCDI